MTKMSTIDIVQNYLQQFTNYIRKLYGNNPYKIILFSSQTRGDATPDSDIDILIVTNKNISKSRRCVLISVISDLTIDFALDYFNDE